jgi:hypothetical protein
VPTFEAANLRLAASKMQAKGEKPMGRSQVTLIKNMDCEFMN